MLIEVKQWPESQEVMDDPEWFFVMSGRHGHVAMAIGFDKEDYDIFGPSAYGRIIEKEESDDD